MNIAELLETLRQQGVQIHVDGDKLRINAPTGVLTAEHKAQLTERKPEIIEFLNLAAKVHAQQTGIVPLQSLGSRPPIFAAAGHNGDVFCYRLLAQHLGLEQPLFGLQPRGYDPGTKPLVSVERLAAYYATQIKAFRPGQSCVIVGYCAGGTIAFELVRQLQAANHPVIRLVLFGAPYSTWYAWPSQLMALVRHGAKRTVHGIGMVLHGRRKQATAGLLARLPSRSKTNLEDHGLMASRRLVETATARAVAHYRPQPLQIHADIMMPGKYVMQTATALLAWSGVTRSHAVYVGPADSTNDTMLMQSNSAAEFAQLFVNSANAMR